MQLVHNILKIKYTDEGYLPYFPYHLISEDELLCAADEYIQDNYPCPYQELFEKHERLYKRYVSIIERYRDDMFDEKYPSSEYGDKPSCIPDWIYSFMLGVVINDNSDVRDRHDLLELINLDNTYDEFDEEIYASLYDVSLGALGRYSKDYEAWDDFWYDQYRGDGSVEKPENLIPAGENFDVRPPSIFGEPHVIRSLRLEQVGV